jgi:F0F1-type ATP synthase epsilon subunit
MATYKNDWADAWTTNLTTDPAYGAIPPLVQAFDANTRPTITVSDNTGLGGYSIGSIGDSPNTIWSTNTTATGSFTIGPNYSAVGSQLDQSGRMILRGENADLDINGKSLNGWMEKVEERLNILTPNPELEKEWDELRRLGERYRKLEKKCKEKAEVWKKLKSMPKPQTKW